MKLNNGADSGSRTHDIRLETSDDNHFTISAQVFIARSISSLSQSVTGIQPNPGGGGGMSRFKPNSTLLISSEID